MVFFKDYLVNEGRKNILSSFFKEINVFKKKFRPIQINNSMTELSSSLKLQ